MEHDPEKLVAARDAEWCDRIRVAWRLRFGRDVDPTGMTPDHAYQIIATAAGAGAADERAEWVAAVNAACPWDQGGLILQRADEAGAVIARFVGPR